jgi:hypothetical protein
MRKLMLLCWLCLAALFAHAQEISGNDGKQVLEKCVALPSLQSYLPKNADGTYKPLIVLQHGVHFVPSLNAQHQGQSLQFVDKGQLAASNANGHFYFHTFRLENDQATVEFAFNYQQGLDAKSQMLTVQLQKSNAAWSVTSSTIQTR